MDYIFNQTMLEFETILVTSPFSRSHFEQNNNIFIRVREIALEKDIDGILGKLFWKYLRILHKEWIQASFKDQCNQDYLFKVRMKLHRLILDCGTKNNFETTITTHLLCLHEAIWHSLLNQLQAYQVRLNYIDSKYMKFKKRFNV